MWPTHDAPARTRGRARRVRRDRSRYGDHARPAGAAAPLAGTHACAPAPSTRALRVRGATCHRARQVSHFWERHGRYIAGWSEKRYAQPSGVNATGGTYINCRRGRARVFWAEAGE